MVLRESVAPTEHLQLYDKYQFLVTKKAEQDVDQFLSQNQSYEKLIEEIRKYQRLIEEIQYTSRKVNGPVLGDSPLPRIERSLLMSNVRTHSDNRRAGDTHHAW